MVLADIGHLFAHGFRAVITPEIVVVPHSAGDRLLVILAIYNAREFFQFAIASTHSRRARRALIQPVIHVLYAGPSFAIKGDAQNNLVRRHSRSQKSSDGIITKTNIKRWL